MGEFSCSICPRKAIQSTCTTDRCEKHAADFLGFPTVADQSMPNDTVVFVQKTPAGQNILGAFTDIGQEAADGQE
jgi:hypothetical protein